MKKTLMALSLAAITLSAPMTGRAADMERNNFLLRFFDMNVAASQFGRYCRGADETARRAFARNEALIIEKFVNEAARQNPGADPALIRRTLTARQSDIRYGTEKFYMQNDCAHPATAEHRHHFETMVGASADEVRSYVDSMLPPVSR